MYLFLCFLVLDSSFGRDLDRVHEHEDFGVRKYTIDFLENSRLKRNLCSQLRNNMHIIFKENLDVDKHL